MLKVHLLQITIFCVLWILVLCLCLTVLDATPFKDPVELKYRFAQKLGANIDKIEIKEIPKVLVILDSQIRVHGGPKKQDQTLFILRGDKLETEFLNLLNFRSDIPVGTKARSTCLGTTRIEFYLKEQLIHTIRSKNGRFLGDLEDLTAKSTEAIRDWLSQKGFTVFKEENKQTDK